MALQKAIFLSIALVAISHDASLAQTYYFGESLHEIVVSETQEQKLREIESLRYAELKQLQDTLNTTQHKYYQRLFDLETELEQVLTPEQLKSLNEKRLEETREQVKKTADFMGQFANFLESVSAADSLTIFEGLPCAADVELAKIKQKNETIEIDGCSFYSAPLAASQSIKEKLRSTLVDYRAFEPYSGGKFCGGFHPDFCVQWKSGNHVHHALVCLGCAEMVHVTLSGRTTFDFKNVAWDSFAQVAILTFRHQGDLIKKTRRNDW